MKTDTEYCLTEYLVCYGRKSPIYNTWRIRNCYHVEAVFGDMGVALIAVFNAMRVMRN